MKILITQALPDSALAPLRERYSIEVGSQSQPMSREALLEHVREIDGMIPTIADRIDASLLDAAIRLKIIANYGVGYNHIDVDAATERGILVTNTPDVLTDATAELAFALLLATARRIVEGDHRMRSGQFRYWAPLDFLGTEVSGKTLGIVGFGRIGQAMAKRAKAFDMRLLCTTRSPIDPSIGREYGITRVELESLLAQSDFISLHVPLTPETVHRIGSAEFARMKPSAILINTSRGPVVDETALVEALKKGTIAAAGLDVYENEPMMAPGLADLDRVVLLPHIGSATTETRTRMAKMAVANLLEGLGGRIPPNCLNPHAIGRKEQHRR
ncbi:2-hydroxyacid dehydrogenase [Desulfatirhabdium butyrativorans]|uniref:2-hydroxyacid dehydrogenase n=1 Tax=Desulfatirhabdium butyrativorans TaxID=340467 RepID=UPI000416A793|nr:D-glycerate dehydrogenase [Desulfatirhabdium butyrativorans]